MSIFAPAEPESPLARHRILSPTAAIKVSPLCLGAMNFGDAWKQFMGECPKETAFEMLDYFYKMGGNFIDTANGYQDEESEKWIGEWLEARGVRDEMVIATKFSSPYQKKFMKDGGVGSNYVGNSHKHLHLSLEASLKKLRTDYIDLLYLHWWDFTTGVEEVMQSLNRMVLAGKVLYLGISDTPAWIVAKANDYAKQHGMKQFSVYQGQWSPSMRDMEREITDMCYDYGMGIAPWGALGRGNYKTAAQREADPNGRKMGGASEADVKVAAVLEKIATKRNTLMTSIALAWIFASAPNVYPIVGGRNVKHLQGNIEALNIRLTEEEMSELNSAYGFDYGFPKTFLTRGNAPSTSLDASHSFITRACHVMDTTPKVGSAFPPTAK